MLTVMILAFVPFGTGAGADPTFVTGSGRARASLFEIAPRTGGLAIPVNFGKALVTYQGLSATATSGALQPPSQNGAGGDCGGAQPPGGGDGGGAPAPPTPPGGESGSPTSFPFISTLSVSTGDKDAEKGRQKDQGSLPEGSPVSGTFQRQEVSADAAPSGRATSTGGRAAFGPLVEIVQGRTEASAGVIDRKARQAHAVTTIDRLSLLDGLVVLADLRWEATQRTGDGEGAGGGFTVGSILFQGKPLPAPPALPGALPGAPAPPLPDPLAALNIALAPSGLALEAPRFDTAGGVVRVTPMSLRFAESALGRAVLGPIVAGLQPLRDPIVGGLLAVSCEFGLAVTVADVAAGILTGSGGISFDFGGVTATTEGEAYDNPLAGGLDDGGDLGDGGLEGGLGALPELGSERVGGSGLSGPVGDSGLSGPVGDSGLGAGSSSGLGGADLGAAGGNALGHPTGSGAGPGSRSGPALGAGPSGEEVAYADPTGLFGSTSRRLPGQKGGPALAVAALALLTVAALAVADAFHLRRASRSIS